jgi:hypothetical protein
MEQEVLPTGPSWPPQRYWTVEVQAASTLPGIRDLGRLHRLLDWDRRRKRPPKLVDLRLLRHHGAPKPRQGQSRGPSKPRSGPVAKRRLQCTTCSPTCSRPPHAPLAPLRSRRHQASPSSCARPAPPRLEGEGEGPTTADAARALPSDALQRRREEELR